MKLEFTVPGKPIPKGRPRVTRSGWTYTPKRTKEYEDLVRVYAMGARTIARCHILTKAIHLRILFYGANPRADIDNLYKSVSDAMNEVVYVDDSQITLAVIGKDTCPKGEERAEVRIEEI